MLGLYRPSYSGFPALLCCHCIRLYFYAFLMSLLEEMNDDDKELAENSRAQ